MKTKDIVFELIRYRRMLEKQGVKVNAEVFDSAISALIDFKWIPCSETVDIPDYEVIACNRLFGAVAWRNLPEKYKGDE